LLASLPASCRFTPIPGAGFPIGFQFLARDPVPRQGFSDFCTERHFSARFRSHSRGDAQVADSDARGKYPILASAQKIEILTVRLESLLYI
jgi:hypothetical protein